jgi:putative membrane protein
MINYDNKNWFSFIFQHGSKHVEGMWWSVLLMGVLTSILVFLDLQTQWFHLDIDASFLTVVGLVLGLLLVFRTNSAYDKWWEGRKQLGALINTSRGLAVKLQNYLPEHTEQKNYKLHLIYAFAFSLKEHLRAGKFKNIEEEIPTKLLEGFRKAHHKPNFILFELGKEIYKLYEQKVITGEQLIILEKDTQELMNILGACERIKNTPIPMAYALHLKRVLLVYSFSLPFVMVNKLGWWSVPIVLIIFYTMVGVELIGEEIEDPFGLDENDLPVDEICGKIKYNIKEIELY